MAESDSSGPVESGPRGNSGRRVRVAETDLAILTAFCRPYLDDNPQFAVPAPNNEILEELSRNGIYLDLDTLRGHLRNLYAKFGVEDGLNPTQKRARLAELVYKDGVIAGWEPREEASEIRPRSLATPVAPSLTSPPNARILAGAPGAQRASKSRQLLHDHVWVAVGLTGLLLVGAIVVLFNLGGPERQAARVAPPENPGPNVGPPPAKCANNLAPGHPYKRPTGHIAARNGILSCDSAPFDKVYIRLQRLPGGETLTRRYLPGFVFTPFKEWNYRDTVQWPCRGVGTYSYRVEMRGYGGSPSYMHKIGPTRRISC
jgi:hypothetical protein